MIIYEDMSYEYRSDYPDTDWTGEAKYIISDVSSLRNKYEEIYDSGVIPELVFEETEEGEQVIVDVICPEGKLDIVNKIKECEMTISDLEAQLSAEDYKIIKCYEASLSQSEMPYDVEELIRNRNYKRLRINEIQGVIEKLRKQL